MKAKEEISRPDLTDKDLFVLYSPPDNANHYLIIQDSAKIEEPEDLKSFKGFIFESFQRDEVHKTIYINNDRFLLNPYIDFRPKHSFERVCIAKEKYLNLAEYFKTLCESENFDKLVLSRVKKLYRDSANLMPLFLALKQKYPYAFIYLINIPGESCWIGATPEILISKKGDLHKTMALAGTMKAKSKDLDSIVWGKKEIHEQALVDRYFEDIIVKIDAKFSKEGPFTKQAGQALHLCTTFEFETKDPLKQIVSSFHPSPAICGIPKKASFDFIINSEPHKRLYYTGFLGPIDEANQAQLFVNLRCMEVSEDAFFLYVGGGITRDSDPISEWEETELKSSTLQSIIEKMYLYSDVIR